MSNEPEELVAVPEAAAENAEPEALLTGTETPAEADAAAAPAEPAEPAAEPKEKRSLFNGLASVSVYTWMLVLSALAIAVAVLLLALELQRYNFDVKGTRGRALIPATNPNP